MYGLTEEVPMKIFTVSVLLICLAFPVFSQNANTQRFRALGDTMDRTLSNSNSNLEYYNELALDNSNTRTYTDYLRKHNTLAQALNDSEKKLDFYIRTNDKPRIIKEERDNYERLIKELDQVKKDYDNWLSSVR